MSTPSCTIFLQWALPRLRLRWPGFRKVRRQPCKLIKRRIRELRLEGFGAYRQYLEERPEEWELLDRFCRITISRFYRGQGVFNTIKDIILPELAQAATASGTPLRCWSAGCASGEEPYSLALIWQLELKARFSGMDTEIIATDIDGHLLGRADEAVYPGASLKDLPPAWRKDAFEPTGELFRLRPEFRKGVRFLQQDIRREMPPGPFHLVLCRNLAAMYFEESLQREVFERIRGRMAEGGYLVLGKHGRLPEGMAGWESWQEHLRISRAV
ncbi:MAG: hypothetical protein J5I98_36350 [Phaeodactylibacter sp.]|nr:hypothetical protein [Phaeodactylibacter sp.]